MNYTIPAVERVLRILELASHDEAPSSTARLARLTAMSPSSCYRAVATLREAGWLRVAEDRLLPDSKLLEVAHACAGSGMEATLIKGVLEQLAAKTGLSTKYSVRFADQAVTKLRANGGGEFALGGRNGAAFTITVGSSGSALLADASDDALNALIASAPPIAWAHQTPDDFLRRVRAGRENGLFRDSGSYRPSVHSLSVPLRALGGKVTAALTLLGMPEDFTDDAIAGMVDALRLSAKSLTNNESEASR
jgi:DNA-binding IclR family transcriptional regulator